MGRTVFPSSLPLSVASLGFCWNFLLEAVIYKFMLAERLLCLGAYLGHMLAPHIS